MFFSKLIPFIKANSVFILSLLLIHCAYFGLAWGYEGICNGDSDEYLKTAENFKYHFECYNWVWTDQKNPAFYSLRPPIYGIFIFLLKTVCHNDYFVLFFQNILSICTWLLTLHISHQLKPDFKIEIPIIVSLLIVPSQMIMVNTIGADWLLQFWLTFALFFLVKFIRNGSPDSIAGYNISLALAVLTKPVMMYFWIPNLLVSFYFFYHKRSFKILICSLILPLTVLCWSLRNYNKTGLFHYSSIKTQNILDLNAGAVLIKLYGAKEANIIKNKITDKAEKIEKYPEKCEFIVQNAMTIIKDHPVLYSYCHVRGMFNFMLSIGRYDLKNFFNKEFDNLNISIAREIEKQGLLGFLKFYFQNVNICFVAFFVMAFVWNIVILAGFLTFCMKSTINIQIKIFIALLVFYSAFVCGPGGDIRFKLAVLPYLILTLSSFYKNSIFRRTTL